MVSLDTTTPNLERRLGWLLGLGVGEPAVELQGGGMLLGVLHWLVKEQLHAQGKQHQPFSHLASQLHSHALDPDQTHGREQSTVSNGKKHQALRAARSR